MANTSNATKPARRAAKPAKPAKPANLRGNGAPAPARQPALPSRAALGCPTLGAHHAGGVARRLALAASLALANSMPTASASAGPLCLPPARPGLATVALATPLAPVAVPSPAGAGRKGKPGGAAAAARNPASAPVVCPTTGAPVSWYSGAAGAAGIAGQGGNPNGKWARSAVARGLYAPTLATQGKTSKRQAVLAYLAGQPGGANAATLKGAVGAGAAVLGALRGNGHLALLAGVYTVTPAGLAALASGQGA
jgi:hypothetical protein